MDARATPQGDTFGSAQTLPSPPPKLWAVPQFVVTLTISQVAR